jgi:single-strand DNA-binding protein
MSSVNRIILAGNLGSDPEHLEGRGGAFLSFTLATNEAWTDQQGARQERTEWHRVLVFGKLATACAEGLIKGSKVLLEGKIHYNSWEDNEGVTRYQTQVIASSVTFLSAAPQKSERQPFKQQHEGRPGRSYGRQTSKARGW